MHSVGVRGGGPPQPQQFRHLLTVQPQPPPAELQAGDGGCEGEEGGQLPPLGGQLGVRHQPHLQVRLDQHASLHLSCLSKW